MSGDKAGESTRELQQIKTRLPEERKGKPCGSEEHPRVPSATLSLHGDRHRGPGLCECEAPPRAPSTTLSLHDHWCPKTEALAAQPALPATRVQPHPKNAGLVRRSGEATKNVATTLLKTMEWQSHLQKEKTTAARRTPTWAATRHKGG
jgi:hypothetical protein